MTLEALIWDGGRRRRFLENRIERARVFLKRWYDCAGVKNPKSMGRHGHVIWNTQTMPSSVLFSGIQHGCAKWHAWTVPGPVPEIEV